MFLRMLPRCLRVHFSVFNLINFNPKEISAELRPENGMAVCDVFTCGEQTNPRSGATYMYEAMGATDLVSEIFNRPLQ